MFILGNQLTVADLFAYAEVYSVLESLNHIQRFDLNNVTRWFDLIQNIPSIAAKLPPIPIREKEKEAKGKPDEAGAAPKKEKEPAVKVEKAKPAAPTAKPAAEEKPADKPAEKKEEAKPAAKPAEKKEQKKAEKQEKEKKEPASDKPKPPAAKGAPKEAKEPKEPKGKKAASTADDQSDISRCDIRVGKIISIEPHPDADSLFVEKIDLGESTGPRTVVSGLRKFYKPEDLNGRMVVVLANLKPAKMRGIESAAMVLAASNHDHTHVEVLDPPAGVAPGDRVTFEGETAPPEPQLNPKKGVFERVAVDLKTNDQCIATYKGLAFQTAKGPVKVLTLKSAGIK